MNNRPLLIVSSSLRSETLLVPPYNLSPDDFFLTGFESLQFMSLSRFEAIILDSPSQDMLRKLSMGLRDTSVLEGLWDVVWQQKSPKIYVLVQQKSKPPKEIPMIIRWQHK